MTHIRMEIVTYIFSIIFYINLYRLFDKKIYYNVIHSIIYSICTIFATFMKINSSNLNAFYKLVLIQEIGYNISDIILNTKKTNGKYLNHHFFVLVIIFLSLLNKVDEDLTFFSIGIVQFGNIFYHMARLKIIHNRYSFIFYSLSNIVTFVYLYYNLNFNFMNEEKYLAHSVMNLSAISILIWRLKESGKMYKLLNLKN